MDVLPEFYLGELPKDERRKMDDLIAKISMAATFHGRGKDVLAYVYLAGLYHGSSPELRKAA